MPNAPFVVAVGEVLWDLLPGGEMPGGAPANFARHARSLGNRTALISRVGADSLGARMRACLDEFGVETSLLQCDAGLATGTVSVELSTGGSPAYVIHRGVAWDALECTDSCRAAAAQCDAVCFGSLAQRDARAREGILSILAAVRPGAWRVFDANLRQHYYSADILEASLRLCTLLKVNEDELPHLLHAAGFDPRSPKAVSELIEKYNLRVVAITRGERGSSLLAPGTRSDLAAPRVSVVDTVGAGDAFTAALVTGLLQRRSLAETHRLATEVAAWVCTQRGATPALPDFLIRPFHHPPTDSP